MEKYLTAKDTNKPALMEEASGIKSACSDPKVFNQLYLAYVRPIYRYIFSIVGDIRQTEDLTAQVFLAIDQSKNTNFPSAPAQAAIHLADRQWRAEKW